MKMGVEWRTVRTVRGSGLLCVGVASDSRSRM